MDNDPNRGERQSVVPFVVGALLLALYVASAGPMVGMNSRGVISDRHWETNSALPRG